MKGVNNFYKKCLRNASKTLAIVFGSGFVLMFILYIENSGDVEQRRKISESKITNVTENIDPFEKYTDLDRIEKEEMLKKIDKLEKEVKKSKKLTAKNLDAIKSQKEQTSDELQALKIEMDKSIVSAVEAGVKKQQDLYKVIESDSPFKKINAYYPTQQGNVNRADNTVVSSKPTINIQPAVEQSPKPKLGFGMESIDLEASIHDRINAGDIVKGVLIDGLEVSSGTTDSANPPPVLMELSEGLNAPGTWFFKKYRKCKIVGAAIANISTERLEIRLETLNCIDRNTGIGVDTAVNGWVTDEAGIVGVKGRVVLPRAGKMMANAVITGTLAGAAKTIGQLANPTQSFNPFTGNVNSTNNRSVMGRQIAASAVESGLGTLVDYSVSSAKKAEPVIQVSAGRKIDIHFKHSVTIGDSTRKLNVRDQAGNVAGQVADFYGVGGKQLPVDPSAVLNEYDVNTEGTDSAVDYISSMRR